jgi:hypothetical protein
MNLSNIDIIFNTVIIVLFFVLVEQLYAKKPENFSNCPSVCNRIEKMTDMAKVEPKLDLVASNLETKIDTKIDTLPAIVNNVQKKTEEVFHNEDDKVTMFKNMLEHLKHSVDELHQKINSSQSHSSESSMEKPQMENIQNRDMKHNIKEMLQKRDIRAGIERNGSREEEDVIYNEMGYTDYNHLPLADNYDNDSFEYGYSFLPPEKWYPQPPFPPMCVTEKKCNVMPVYASGTPMDVKEWNDSRRITQPDNIKTKYIKEKLNSGR